MTDKQSNWLDMFRAVYQFYLDNQVELDIVPARTTAFANHQANILAIEVKAGLQSTNTTGLAANKAVLRTALENSTIAHIKPAAAYAVSIGDNALKAEMDYNISAVQAIKDESFGPWAQHRLNLINPIILPLAAYGLTPLTVTAWQADINAFIPVISAPRNAIINKAGHTSSLKTMFPDANKFLDDTLDNLMSPYRASNPELFFNYRSAREIIDRGHGPVTPPTPGPTPITGIVSSGSVVSVFSPSTPEYTPTITLRIKNTTSVSEGLPLYFYTANNPGDGYPGYGISLAAGQELEVDITALGGFRPFLNIHNQGPNTQEFEITIL